MSCRFTVRYADSRGLKQVEPPRRPSGTTRQNRSQGGFRFVKAAPVPIQHRLVPVSAPIWLSQARGLRFVYLPLVFTG